MTDDKPDRNRGSMEGLWDATRKTLHVATFRANQYKRIVQKKIDLASLHKKIAAAHADLGKLVDDCRERGEADILAREDIQVLFRRLDGYKNSAALLEEEIETIRGEGPPEGETGSEDEPEKPA